MLLRSGIYEVACNICGKDTMLVHMSQYIITYIVLGKTCTLQVQTLKGEEKYCEVMQNLLLE